MDNTKKEDTYFSRYFKIGLTVVGIIVLIIGAFMSWEYVGANEVVVIQDPMDGELHWFTTPGMKWQNLGHATHYNKSAQFWFSSATDQGDKKDESIHIRFNDGGVASISGSVRWDMPLDEPSLNLLHAKYHGQEAVQHDLIRTVFERSVYFTGPMMSSKESYSEKRNDLIFYIEDQAQMGVYRTQSHDIEGSDLITGEKKTITVTEAVKDPTAPNGILRQEDSPFQTFHIRTYNLSVNRVEYDATVMKQIETQQSAIMSVQTAMATAKQAEQNAITAKKQGEANAATAKWEQEVIKAKAVTEAEQKKEVSKLNMEAAEFYRQEQIKIGQGDGERKKLVMAADGALEMKLETWLGAQQAYAQALAQAQPGALVPYLQMGGDGKGGSFNAADWFSMIGAKTARDLSLDMSVPKGRTTSGGGEGKKEVGPVQK